MIQNEIDKFRKKFFDALIAEEEKKEREKLLAQQNCFHNYQVVGFVNDRGYQLRTCSKCDHSDIKHYRVWEGTKGCIIS
jgi:hypothetical protein